jgi:hypothetical protein
LHAIAELGLGLRHQAAKYVEKHASKTTRKRLLHVTAIAAQLANISVRKSRSPSPGSWFSYVRTTVSTVRAMKSWVNFTPTAVFRECQGGKCETHIPGNRPGS